MSHFDKEIKDEHKGHERYEKLAQEYPDFKGSFEAMAEDEVRHIEVLTDIDTKLHRSQVRSAAQKAFGGKY